MIVLPLIVPIMPDMTKTGLDEFVATMFATPPAKSEGGEVTSATVELGGHANPAPCSVMDQVDKFIALADRNSMTLSWVPDTDETGAARETRLAAAHVVLNEYRMFERRENVWANAEDF